jgi:hypothetical protein
MTRLKAGNMDSRDQPASSPEKVNPCQYSGSGLISKNVEQRVLACPGKGGIFGSRLLFGGDAGQKMQ